MSSVLNTSTMKSPPLVVCEMGSFDGGIVSAAANLGPGTAAFVLFLDGSDICVLAATGVVRAATPASVAPLRKLRRPASGELLRFDMVPSREAVSDAIQLRTDFIYLATVALCVGLVKVTTGSKPE